MKRITLPEEIKKRVQIKNVKLGIGHDLMGMYCDIFLDKKKIGYFNDDGWGGEPDINISQENQQIILELLQKYNWRTRMFTELGWDFYEDESKISDHSIIDSLIEHLTDEKQKEKVLKKIEKQSQNSILIGTWDNYSVTSFNGKLSLEQLIKVYGVQKVQEYIDNQLKTKIKDGEEILNTNFEALGLKK